MRSFWQRWRDPLHVHGKLEARRSRARPEFVRQLADELGERPAPARLRHAFAVALTLLLLVAAGILGGTGYAAHAAGKVSNAVSGISGGNDQGIAVSNRGDDDDDDDRGGGGGGGGDDDDDGGGGGGDDDDDDDPDDDQYEEDEEQCELAISQAHREFHVAGGSGHRAFHRWMRVAERECDGPGGGDDDDDDD